MTHFNPRHGAASFNTPTALLKTHFPPLTHYVEQWDIQSAFTEKQHTAYGGARPRGLWLQLLSVLHVAQSHADLLACVYRPACCITHCIGADPSQYEIIALVLSSLAESPSLYRMATKECPPPLSASSVASLPHFMEMHVCDLW